MILLRNYFDVKLYSKNCIQIIQFSTSITKIRGKIPLTTLSKREKS